MSTPLTGRTIGITGVSGFIGGHLARKCAALGATVRGLDLSSPQAGANGKLIFVAGDVTNAADAQSLCAGCDSVIHAAAVVREGGDPRPFERINVGGTRTVARAAEAAGVARFIQISSVMVYGFDIQGEVDETAPLDGAGNPYCQTKIDSEREALALHSNKMQVGIIRCGDVYGPGSIPWTIRPVRMMLNQRFRLINGGTGLMNHVYVDNLVDGILLALDSPHTGEACNISDGVATPFREFFGCYADMVGLNPMRSMSAGFTRRLLKVQNGVVRLLGRQPRLHSSFVSYVTRQGVYSIDKARQQLGYEPRVGLPEGMRHTEVWLRNSGMLAAKSDA